MDSSGVIDFLIEAGKLKKIARTGWVEVGVDYPESIADHSYRTAIIAMLLSDLNGLDSGTMICMALLHDIAEARVGDLTPAQKNINPNWVQRENDALHSLMSLLPQELQKRYTSTMKDYSDGNSVEARLVHAADKLDMLLKAIEYDSKGVNEEKLKKFMHVSFEGGVEAELERSIKERWKIKRQLSSSLL
jgi:putative hydrolases of HD superfamily